jgi:hypothetical protein
MNTILAYGKRLFGKAALATVALGGFLAFFGAGSASAHPRVYVSVYARPHAVFVGPGFYGPQPVYVGPVYRPYYRPYYRHYRPYRIWDEREHCWRYR